MKKFLVMLMSIVLIMANTTAVYAGTKEYKIADLDVVIKLSDELYALTRGVTAADPALKILDVTAEEIRMTFPENNVYLEAFPNPVEYEIVLTGFKVSAESVKDFDGLSDDEILNTINKAQGSTYFVETVNNVKYVVADMTTDDPTVPIYIRKYTTVKNGISKSLSLQSQKVIDKDIEKVFNDALNSLEYKQVDPSISDSPYFAEITGTIIAGVGTIGILLLVLYLFARLDKKKK